ncbi:MAG: hypothetical protein FWK04_13930 [Nostoc sp. GBBB01]|uniref:Uncharacterized protein n=1 Tax=Nostoc punctiforme FACHB-252 TaxID=1357509 RepID=A0ABR8H7X5_NOSPU|nr:hypothetical protein [Nostoc punctiforme]MBD2611594.1 hypothetical protein [Nostoc punctiforme FACHB-252]MBL1200152.1 hypothetical protein [Nostoc sp. GBBB01]
MNTEELVYLLKKYQNTSSEIHEKTNIKTKFIAQLSSCYWWHSRYIINLFGEEVQQIKKDLQTEIEELFQLHVIRKNDLKELAVFLLKEATILQKKYQKKLITDKFINTLAIEIKNAQPNSFQRKQAVQCLIKAMETKNTYKKQGLGSNLQLSPQDYEDAFLEAKGESIRYILDNIDRYDEIRGDFMAWINHWIPIKFLDAAGRILGIKKSQSKKQEEEKISISPADPNSMKEYLFENAEKEFAYYQQSEEIKNLIKEDPNNKLGKPIRKDRTDITFKDVLIAINWEGETFKNLSKTWNIPYTTIKSFYEREFEQVKTDLTEYLQ